MYRASTLDGNILDIPDRKAVLNCTYDIKISTSQADVKTKSQLSGKKWDKATKTLTKNNLIKVEKTEDQVLMKLV